MVAFDNSQRSVLELDPARHARVLGAAGTGKTRVLREVFRRTLERPGWAEGDILVLATNRLVAASLRAAIERDSGRAFGGTPVRTAASLAFALLTRSAALAGGVARRNAGRHGAAAGRAGTDRHRARWARR